jgi:hypothetical protein
MPAGKPQIQVVTACLLLGPDSPIHRPDAGIGFSA